MHDRPEKPGALDQAAPRRYIILAAVDATSPDPQRPLLLVTCPNCIGSAASSTPSTCTKWPFACLAENRLARMTMKITGYSGIYRDIAGFRGMDGTMTIYPMVATRSEVHQGVFDDVSRGFHRQASHRLGVMRSREIPLFFHPIPLYHSSIPSRYIPVYPTISRYSSSNPIAPRCAPTMGIPGAKRSRRRRSRATRFAPSSNKRRAI